MKAEIKEALIWIVKILEKHEIPFQITGGMAARIYGAKRKLKDIDMDAAEEDMEKIVPEVKRYIVFGPAQYKDERWNLELLTLKYLEQKIDISGANKAKIFNDQKKAWQNFPANLKTAQIYNVYGIQVPVVNPKDLIKYKKLLSGKHQKEDIKFIQDYIKSKPKYTRGVYL